MFLLLRIALVIGLIVYLSPARHVSQTRLAGSPDIESAQRLMGLAAPALERAGELSRLWGVLPEGAREPVLRFTGDSDAHIVRGLIALLIALLSGRSAAEVLETDPQDTFRALGLSEHLTPQRSNGVRSMVERIKRDARAALAEAA